ncbi:phospholipase D zeta 1-like isoform X2 [Argentina anserina]|uniref:phospholipase D zeta 1-like isoform X2 n=1 Tax=Argentina anserina TaxID=57926 RepID=UPI0021762AEA|nr:phospholipase D zeta 1-like isoform X2 [Potentilla anserina]
MSSEKLIPNGAVHSDSFRQCGEMVPIFEELPVATIVSVSRPDTGDISPMLLSYTIEFQYKQFKWRLLKKASQVLYLHFALKKRAIIEEFHEKQEQVKEWLHSIGIADQTAVVQDDDEPDDGAVPLYHEDSVRNRYVPSRAALPIIRPALGSQQSVSDLAKVAMLGYLSHFLGNMDLVNSREVCKFLEVSRLSFLQEYGPKLKEGYVMVKHLPNYSGANSDVASCAGFFLNCCSNNWLKVWAVLKPGFLALLDDPFDTELLDIIIFNAVPSLNGSGGSGKHLASHVKERNPLRYTFTVASGSHSLRFRTTSNAKVKDWVNAINDAGLRPHEGWCHPHRFSSFAPPRGLTDDGSQAQWFIDGEAAFEAIASSIEGAKSEIFITGWWLCPELYLRRPFCSNSSSRLDALLEAKAKEGVQIYILLYKEVSLALKINSLYSKKKLLDIHENVRVMRHPDRFPTGIYLWSHHEKLVIVDYQICYIGGLDLCFGRYDTIEHKVGDCPPSLWPGKDYYNPRESEPNSWEDVMEDELEREKVPRMPWHDVHCALWGPPCRDIARHFVQRWNHAKKNKAPNEQALPLLMPQHHMVIPHYLGRSEEINIEKRKVEENQLGIQRENSFSSVSPLQNIPLLLPQEADGLESPGVDQKLSVQQTHHPVDQPNEISGSVFCPRNPTVEVLDPDAQMNGLMDDFYTIDHESGTNINSVFQSGLTTSNEWSESLEESDHAVAEYDCGQTGPRTACKCQIIRSVSQWSAGTSQPEESIHNAYCSLIEKAEHFVYIENQFFISGLSGDEIIHNRVLEVLYRRIVLAHKEQKCFRVIVVMPLLPGFQGGVDDYGAATVRAIMHWQYRTITWEKYSILHKLKILLGPKTHDYISFYGLRTYGKLFEGGPLSTSQVYVHSKVMIVDDRVALIGSSNINDRSLLGSRDSEICVVIEDKEFLESSMAGQPWKAGKFSYSLRCSLWSEHLGLHAGEINQISDPVSDSTYKDLWLVTAKENSIIYQNVFSCTPNDSITSRATLRQSMAFWKEKLGHTTIDLGIAPKKLEILENGEIKETDPMERLKHIRGHLVSFPLEFMNQEDLRPVFNESEFYTSPQVFM